MERLSAIALYSQSTILIVIVRSSIVFHIFLYGILKNCFFRIMASCGTHVCFHYANPQKSCYRVMSPYGTHVYSQFTLYFVATCFLKPKSFRMSRFHAVIRGYWFLLSLIYQHFSFFVFPMIKISLPVLVSNTYVSSLKHTALWF